MRVWIISALTVGLWLALAGCKPAAYEPNAELKNQLRTAMRQQKHEDAIQLARALLEKNPQDNEAWGHLTHAQLAKRDFAAAQKTLDDWRRAVLEPSPRLHEFEGDLALEHGDLQRAAAAWHEVLNDDAKNARVLEKIALLERRQRHWAEEAAAWSGLIERDESGSAHANRALARRHLHEWDEALRDVRRAKELSADDSDVQNAVRLFDRLNKFLPDIRTVDARLAATPSDAEGLTDRALLFLRAGDPDVALDDAQQAAKLATWAMRPVLFQAIAFIGTNRADDCVKLLVRKTIRLEQFTPEMLETLARLDRDISVERTNPEHFVSRAWALNDLDQPALAANDAEVAAKLDPNNAAALAEWGYALVKLGAAEDGYAKVRHATEIDPHLASAWQYRGELEMQGGNFPAAVDSLSHALAISQTATALRKREECYMRLGMKNRADEDHVALQQLAARAIK